MITPGVTSCCDRTCGAYHASGLFGGRGAGTAHSVVSVISVLFWLIDIIILHGLCKLYNNIRWQFDYICPYRCVSNDHTYSCVRQIQFWYYQLNIVWHFLPHERRGILRCRATESWYWGLQSLISVQDWDRPERTWNETTGCANYPILLFSPRPSEDLELLFSCVSYLILAYFDIFGYSLWSASFERSTRLLSVPRLRSPWLGISPVSLQI